jgi:diguanylate cyclase (GGDEF)-like protein
MSYDTKPEPELNDYEEVRHSLRRLDWASSWFYWNAVLEIALLVATVAISFLASLSARFPSLRPLDATVLVRGLLLFMLFSNAFTLYHQRHFKRFRQRLAEQMQAAIRQRMRADKFYGLAILDPLTGLYNRRFGQERLQEELARAERRGHDLAVLVFDLDSFKQINDEYGHAAGDLALKEFSRRLKRAIRACDVPVRLGGDEFLLVLPECTRQNVHIILSRLGAFEVMVNRQRIPVSFSRGQAQHQPSDTPESILRRADEALYRDKAARGRLQQPGAAQPAAGPVKA